MLEAGSHEGLIGKDERAGAVPTTHAKFPHTGGAWDILATASRFGWPVSPGGQTAGAVKSPVHICEVKSEVWYEGTEREIRGKALCDIGGTAKVGVGYVELPPGSHTKPGHWRSKEEEHLYVLSGLATLHLGGACFTLRPGSYVCFPAGQPVAHYIHNTGHETFIYLMIAHPGR
jgi:uncharacterized cupin superfamily protein